MVKNRYELLKGIKLVRKASEYKVKGDGNLDLVIGVDFGSDSARAVVIDAKDGHKEGEGICEYPRWMEGICTVIPPEECSDSIQRII